MPDAQDLPGPPRPTPRPPRVVHAPGGGWGSRPARRRRRLTVLSGVVVALLVVAAVAVAAGLLDEREQVPADARCTGGPTVRVVADPTVAASLERAVAAAAGSLLSTGVCAQVEVLARASVTAAQEIGAATDPADLPQVWVPDSSVWLGRAAPAAGGDGVGLTVLGSLVSTPVVLATSPQVATEEGWTATGPTWAQAMASTRDLALPDLATSAAGLQALVAVRTSVEDPEQARGALTSAAVALQRGRTADAGAALDLVTGAGAGAPLVPTSEQQVFRTDRGTGTTSVVGVQPRDGHTSLDYPLVRLDTEASEAGVDAAAVEGVVRLLEGAGREAAVADGFRLPLPVPADAVDAVGAADDVDAAATADAPAPAPLLLPVPTSADVDVLLAQLEELARPSRVLAVLDASASMGAVTGTGQTRAQVAQAAVTGSLALLPDSASVGLWFFAVDMGEDGSDHVEVAPLAPLAGTDQRDVVAEGVAGLPDRLTPGGSGLYDTTLAAVRSLREDSDPEATSSVVLVTDGREDDPSGLDLDELLETLAAEADPERPVRVVAVGISEDVDADELTALAEATGGVAYLAERPEDLGAVLLDALRRR